MNIFIIAALSADGFISPSPDLISTDWTCKEDKEFFIEKTKEAGVVVMGSKTFETFGARPLKERRNIIYTKDKTYEGAESTSETPLGLIERLANEGETKVAICGGTHIYSLFMESGLVNTLYLSIHPILFGTGLPLFNKAMQKKLTLASVKNLDDNTLLLEYSVCN